MFIPSKEDGSFLDNSVFIGLSRNLNPQYLFTFNRLMSYIDWNDKKQKIPVDIYEIKNDCLHLTLNSYNYIYQKDWYSLKAKDVCKTIKKIEFDLNCIIYFWHKVRYISNINNFYQMMILPELKFEIDCLQKYK